MIPLAPRRIWESRDFEGPWHPALRSILSFLEERGEDVEEVDLPDTPRRGKGSSLKFAAGALDNLVGANGGDATLICENIQRVLKNPSGTNIKTLYETLLEEDAIGVVDNAISLLTKAPLNRERLAIFFGWLARNSPDREPVKFAIAMLGLSGHENTDFLLNIGKHEEFTKYAAVALSNSLPPSEAMQAQTKLVRSVQGWGRIDLVQRLAPKADVDLRHWLVREGYKNSIMYEYLACIAAREGRLLEQLQDQIASKDNALLDGAAEIFNALVRGGPAEDMSDYSDGATAGELWLQLINDQPATLLRGCGAKSLADYAAGDVWPKEVSVVIEKSAAAYIGRPELADLVLQHLKSGDRLAYWNAKTLARDVGIDPWPIIFDRQIKEGDADYWYDLMRTDNPDRVDRVIDLAVQQLPLETVATGPGDETGLGPDWKHHSALNYIVQDLDRFPGKGWALVAASLQSPVVRNRNMSAKALEAWPKADWPQDTLSVVRQAIRVEPTPKLKERLEALLRPNAKG
ncbi:MAG: hypothetical protein HKN27_05115 [Silicimonas sp.]|nr:hypothetical protein [Silicimonas sp.]